ncbi:MAG: LamG domain-containing protein, partial [Planctomycetes bacterium]|nr:LamG domain-containing protein [Planctomycetota bacterium]
MRDGRVNYDIGFVGCVTAKSSITDGKWHHVALTGGKTQKIYVDGKLEGSAAMEQRPDPKGSVLMIGYTSKNFPDGKTFEGDIDELGLYPRVLNARDIKVLSQRKRPLERTDVLAYYPFEGQILDASLGNNHPREIKQARFTSGRVGQALRLAKGAYLQIATTDSEAPDAALWTELRRNHRDETAIEEMNWVREDGIWGADWRQVSWAQAAQRYVSRVQRPSSLVVQIKTQARGAKGPETLKKVHALYVKARRYDQLLARVKDYQLEELRAMIPDLCQEKNVAQTMLTRLDRIEARAVSWTDGPPAEAQFARWEQDVASLRHQVVVKDNALLDFDEVVFVRRPTYNSNHYYTEFINSTWKPGGNLCVLSLKDGSVRELAPELEGGVFERFDVSFDAKKVVFAWKCAAQEGYRIYEVNIDGTGLRQLTFPPKDEKA